ncbi:MAG: HPr kinase/phosphorylase [Treponema sp.]|nr:MAG: HPr kinase/phosphorylase [Treponema sp.]
MNNKSFSVLDLLEVDLNEELDLSLKCLSGHEGLSRIISSPDINRPGLALTGFFDSFAYSRIQLFGRGENAFIKRLSENEDFSNIKRIFSYEIPCCIFSHSLQPPEWFLEISEAEGCPVLISDLPSTDLSMRLLRLLVSVFSPKTTLHGVLVEVYGLGILILGDSGVGKSETALELVERGHKLIADDVVEIFASADRALIGQGANRIIGHHMEIRGLGIINIQKLYGVSSVLDSKRIHIVAKLEVWDSNKIYDRLGTEELWMEILGVKIPLLEIPIKPGRNIPIILETAAKNERLKKMGYFAAKEFNKNVINWIESDALRAPYYTGDEDY